MEGNNGATSARVFVVCSMRHGKQVELDYEKMEKRIPYGGNSVSKIRMLRIWEITSGSFR